MFFFLYFVFILGNIFSKCNYLNIIYHNVSYNLYTDNIWLPCRSETFITHCMYKQRHEKAYKFWEHTIINKFNKLMSRTMFSSLLTHHLNFSTLGNEWIILLSELYCKNCNKKSTTYLIFFSYSFDLWHWIILT